MEQLCQRLRDRTRSPPSPTTSTPRRTPRSWRGPRPCRSTASWASRPAAAPTRPSARTASINLAAIDDLNRRFPDLDLILIESGGDNLAATFSPELADLTVYVIDVSGGEKIPRKGGPGITRSDLLVINKTDLAPHVGASLDVMERDTERMRRGKPYVFSNMKSGRGRRHRDRLHPAPGRARR